MPPPCKHDPSKCVPGEQFVLGRDCHPCWLFVHNAMARARWGGDGPPVPVTRGQPIHFPDATPEQWERMKADAAKAGMQVQTEAQPAPKPIAEGPGWFRKVLVNFPKALVKHVWHLLPQTPTPEQERRLTICLGCELFNLENGTCTHPNCGCPVRKKTRWLDQSCPIGKW